MADKPIGPTSGAPQKEQGASGTSDAAPPFEKGHVIRLSAEDQRRFAEALINPPEPNEALKRAAQHHRVLIKR